MKQFLILSLALCLSAAVFSSCNNEDNTPEAPSISFKDNTDGTFYAKAGFPLTLTPQVENGDGAQYSWTLGGQQVGTSATYTFQSDETGTYALTLTVKTAGGEATQQLSVTVEPVDVHYRPATQNSLAACNAVYEYTPAPGQFINEPQSGFKNENTPEAACAYALERMGKSAYVSLGGFGGYLIVGFDHSIYNEKGADFSIAGNSFSGSSEPGIVYVMQDENGNGKPDDTWYELKGSEYGKPETLKDYSVTYYKPQSAGTDIRWEDNEGNEGMVCPVSTNKTPITRPGSLRTVTRSAALASLQIPIGRRVPVGSTKPTTGAMRITSARKTGPAAMPTAPARESIISRSTTP